MDVENQKITIRVTNFTENHFQSLGYNIVNGDTIIMPVKDLPNGSGLKIDVECYYCGKIFKKSWRRYLQTKDKCCCDNCKEIKMMETSLNKYGNVCSLRNPEIQAKSTAINMEKLGVQYPFQNKDILLKCRQTYYRNNKDSIITSKQQKHLCELFSGELNYQIDMYFVDMLLSDNIVVEYDGGGHSLCVKFNTMSQDDFINKEFLRENVIISYGYKIIRIVCDNDILPQDDTLLNVKNQITNTLLSTSYSIGIYNTSIQEISFK